jgi:hypothetical protein
MDRDKPCPTIFIKGGMPIFHTIFPYESKKLATPKNPSDKEYRLSLF